MVIGREAVLRARLAQLLSRGGYRAEVAESLAHARRAGLDDFALAIIAPDGLDAPRAAAIEELRAAVGRVLVIGSDCDPRAGRDVIDASDEARLLARIAEALAPRSESEAAEQALEFAGYRLDLTGHSLTDSTGRDIPLTHSEFALLRVFVERAGRVLSRDRLLQLTARRDAEPYDRSVDMQILRLRRKIEPDPKRPSMIVTVPGTGYKFVAAIGEPKLASRLEPGPEATTAPSGAAPRAPERRHVTALAAELAPARSDRLPSDPEDLHAIVGAFRRNASAIVTQHGGVIGESRGREVFAYFGYPMAQENDAERAVRAALAIQRERSEYNNENISKGAPELSARIGLDCGLAVVDSTGEVFGDAPDVAARVMTAAEPGSVLVTTNVLRQVSGLFVIEERGASELAGVSEPVDLFRIVRGSGGRRRAAAHTPTPFVGREEELGLLARQWGRARAGDGQLVLIVGEPGIGKSRLVEEFRAKLAETSHTWIEWSALQLLQNTPLHPIAEWGRIRFGADAPAEQRLADLENTLALIGLDPTEYAPLLAPLVNIPLPAGRAANLPPEELRRRQLEAVVAWVLVGARSQAVALVFEDLQWADPTSLDLMRALAERGGQAPLLVIATARPEFRPPWSLRSHHSVISLAGLDRAQIRQMACELAPLDALSKEIMDGISERTGGVPLFIEEVTRLLLERGEQGGVQAIPPTLQQSLAARLDRLGAAREVAQIGAVLGRGSPFTLLRDVAEMSESALQASLERLVDADILFVEGVAPQSNYRFKHALIQDAAYESLLKSRRQALHRRAAEILRNEPERAAAEPELVAHHFTEAGLDDLAIEWWGKAGDQALRRSAFQEAITHLGRAIAMADKAGEIGPTVQRVKLQADYGLALSVSQGVAAKETEAASARSKQLLAEVNDPAARFSVYRAEIAASLMSGQIGSAISTGETYLGGARNAGGLADLSFACFLLGQARMYQGALTKARKLLEEELRTDPGPNNITANADWMACGMAVLAIVCWHLGEIERARTLIEQAKKRADESQDWLTLAGTYGFASTLEGFSGDAEASLRDAETANRNYVNIGFVQYSCFAKLPRFLARARLGDPEVLREFRHDLAEYGKQTQGQLPNWLGNLAEFEAGGGDTDMALQRIEEALALAQRTNQSWTDSRLHRIRGDILLKADPENPTPAEEAYCAAVSVAKEQGARSFGLQAALKLSKLYQSTARPVEAHAVLAPALEGYASTPEMPEIAEAQALLAALAETDEVKAEAARRQQRRQLHVAYGNALIAARGYGAPETAQAFARASASAVGEKDTPERLAADYGLWVGSIVRGELSAARAYADAFLSDVEARPDSPEAGVAHRAAGFTLWFAGEYHEAREHLERALALFQSGRDDDLAFRFGQDAGVAAMPYLALTLWALGDVEHARSLIESARTRSANVTHIGTHAFAKWHAALFELMRGDLARAAQNGVELARLAREHDLSFWRASGVFFEGLATAESGALGRGLEDMRRGLELFREQLFDGLIKIVLAAAEARAGDVDRALALLNEALATSERIGHHAFDAELHRARGEMLLRRNPANPALAEEAFQAAIAVTKHQATRSFELRAALALAKLYQSTGRAVEAHAVLASALEGFSQTPEMPEIAEAQALLAALAETDEVKAETTRRAAKEARAAFSARPEFRIRKFQVPRWP